MQLSACLVINPIITDNFAALFNCTLVDQASDYDGPDLKVFILVGTGALSSIDWSTGA